MVVHEVRAGSIPLREDSPAPALASHEPVWAAFLDQGRWLLDQQQGRGASFQVTAATLLGFDGVVLSILASSDFLATDGAWSFRAVVGKLGVLALALSAFAAVKVIAPRSTGAVTLDDTLDEWKKYHDDENADVRPVQLFANMLLSRDAIPDPATPPRRWCRQSQTAKQVLHDAAHLADYRSKWAKWSAWSLMGAVLMLVLAVWATPGTTPADGRSSSTTVTMTPHD